MSDVAKDHRLEDIMLYKQGSLTDEERAELEEHLRGCAECQATLEEVTRFLPALQKALVPDEPSAEELLAWGKAQMRARKLAQDAQPARFFTRMRVAVVGFALAGASAIFIAVQALLQPMGPAMVVQSGEDAGSGGRVLSAPRPPHKHRPDVDAGMDAGTATPALPPEKLAPPASVPARGGG